MTPEGFALYRDTVLRWEIGLYSNTARRWEIGLYRDTEFVYVFIFTNQGSLVMSLKMTMAAKSRMQTKATW
jgi:hypothetical protein